MDEILEAEVGYRVGEGDRALSALSRESYCLLEQNCACQKVHQSSWCGMVVHLEALTIKDQKRLEMPEDNICCEAGLS